MTEKPRDILEFLRRAGREPASAVAEPPARPQTAANPPSEAELSQWMLVKKRQVWIAGIAAGLFAILTFLIGMAFGGPDSAEEAAAAKVGVWTIRAIEYDDTTNGQVRAKSTASQLRRLASDEVTIQPLDRDRKLLVTVGSWLKNPNSNEQALKLLEWVRTREVDGRDRRPFKDAFFYRIER